MHMSIIFSRQEQLEADTEAPAPDSTPAADESSRATCHYPVRDHQPLDRYS